MLDAYKELTPVVYGENAIKFLRGKFVEAHRLCFAMHWHDRMELLRVLSGRLVLHLGEAQFNVEAGQVAVFVPGQLHCGFAGEEGVSYHTIMFDVEKFCNATVASDKYLVPIYKYGTSFHAVAEDERITAATDRLVDFLTEEEEKNPLLAVGAVYEIIGYLYQYCGSGTRLIHRPDESFGAILEYINIHYGEKISARDISQKFGYNETYFCRRFRQTTGITLMRYIQALRMERAQKLLKSSKEEIGNIAWQCGFSDISYFSNCFKKHFGFSPSEFRGREN